MVKWLFKKERLRLKADISLANMAACSAMKRARLWEEKYNKFSEDTFEDFKALREENQRLKECLPEVHLSKRLKNG